MLPIGVRQTAERTLGEKVFFWMPTIRLAIPAFLCGVIAAQESIWWTFGTCMALFLIERYPLLILLQVPVALGMYFAGFHVWIACLFLTLSLNIWLEFRCHYLLARKQIKDLLRDLLAPTSSYSFEELAVPSVLVDGFVWYQAKQWMAKKIRRFANLPYEKPVRVFRFQSSDEGKATNAAVAFPVENYSSLIFVRTRLEDLTDGQWFQVYHELAHGTFEGSMMIMKGLKWKTLAPLGFPIFCVLSALCFFATHDWHRWLSLGLLIVGTWFRRGAAKYIAEWNSANNEILADSIALAHPDFEANDKWKKLAENLAKRLEDEAALITRAHSRYFQVTERAYSLRKCLSAGRILVPQEIPVDLDARLLIAFPFYVLAGYYASLPITDAGTMSRTLLVLVPFSWLLVVFNILQTSWWMGQLINAVNEHLQPSGLPAST